MDIILDIFNNNQDIALIISLVINILIALSGVIPSILVTGANILFFGTINGFIISILGETIGAYITFCIYRKGLKKTAENFVDKNKFLKKIVDSSGVKVSFLVFQGRLIPFIPSGFITLAAAISSVKVIPFTIATLFGKIPSIALEALVSYDFINMRQNWIRLFITIVSLGMIYLTLKNSQE